MYILRAIPLLKRIRHRLKLPQPLRDLDVVILCILSGELRVLGGNCSGTI